jgi:hypothetical protein
LDKKQDDSPNKPVVNFGVGGVKQAQYDTSVLKNKEEFLRMCAG